MHAFPELLYTNAIPHRERPAIWPPAFFAKSNTNAQNVTGSASNGFPASSKHGSGTFFTVTGNCPREGPGSGSGLPEAEGVGRRAARNSISSSHSPTSGTTTDEDSLSPSSWNVSESAVSVSAKAKSASTHQPGLNPAAAPFQIPVSKANNVNAAFPSAAAAPTTTAAAAVNAMMLSLQHQLNYMPMAGGSSGSGHTPLTASFPGRDGHNGAAAADLAMLSAANPHILYGPGGAGLKLPGAVDAQAVPYSGFVPAGGVGGPQQPHGLKGSTGPQLAYAHPMYGGGFPGGVNMAAGFAFSVDPRQLVTASDLEDLQRVQLTRYRAKMLPRPLSIEAHKEIWAMNHNYGARAKSLNHRHTKKSSGNDRVPNNSKNGHGSNMDSQSANTTFTVTATPDEDGDESDKTHNTVQPNHRTTADDAAAVAPGHAHSAAEQPQTFILSATNPSATHNNPIATTETTRGTMSLDGASVPFPTTTAGSGEISEDSNVDGVNENSNSTHNNNINNQTNDTDNDSASDDEDVELEAERQQRLSAYRVLLERWSRHIGVLENKSDVRAKILLPSRPCPTLEEITAAGTMAGGEGESDTDCGNSASAVSKTESQQQQQQAGEAHEEKTLAAWSAACTRWWEEMNTLRQEQQRELTQQRRASTVLASTPSAANSNQAGKSAPYSRAAPRDQFTVTASDDFPTTQTHHGLRASPSLSDDAVFAVAPPAMPAGNLMALSTAGGPNGIACNNLGNAKIPATQQQQQSFGTVFGTAPASYYATIANANSFSDGGNRGSTFFHQTGIGAFESVAAGVTATNAVSPPTFLDANGILASSNGSKLAGLDPSSMGTTTPSATALVSDEDFFVDDDALAESYQRQLLKVFEDEE